jgi:ribosomal protein L37AE/L43A
MHNIAHDTGTQPPNYCRNCGDIIPTARWALGFKHCMVCGETLARSVKHTLVPLHKSNYIVVTDLSLLIGINNKQQRN